jgi:hypothetical protein
MRLQLPGLRTPHRRALAALIVCVFVALTNAGVSKAADVDQGLSIKSMLAATQRPTASPEPTSTVPGEPHPTVIPTHGYPPPLVPVARITGPDVPSDVWESLNPTPTLEPPRDPGPIPTIGGGTITLEPLPTIIVTRVGGTATPKTPTPTLTVTATVAPAG